MADISENYKLFCVEYVANKFNAAAAYKKVYPDASYGTCRTNGSRILKKPEVKEYLENYVKDLYAEQMINAETIALELLEMARANKGDEHYPASVKLKAIELLQKQLGLQSQRIDANVNQDINININIVEDDEE